MFILDFPTVAMSTCFMVHAGQSIYVTWWTLSLHETIILEVDPVDTFLKYLEKLH